MTRSTITHFGLRLLAGATLIGISIGCEPAAPAPVQQATQLRARIETDKGAFTILLRPDLAPQSVANFCTLIESGYYHGKEVLNANNIARSFGSDRVAPSYELPREHSAELDFKSPGLIAWTFLNTLPGEANKQPHPTRFFITVAPQDPMHLEFVPFGTVQDGMDVLLATRKGDWIKSARIEGDPSALYATLAEERKRWIKALDELETSGAG